MRAHQDTHSAPMDSSAVRRAFLRLCICNFQMKGRGSIRTAKSVMTLGMTLPRKNFCSLMHFPPGIVLSHTYSTGLQLKMAVKITAIHHAKMIMPRVIAAMRNDRFGIIRTMKESIDALTQAMHVP